MDESADETEAADNKCRKEYATIRSLEKKIADMEMELLKAKQQQLLLKSRHSLHSNKNMSPTRVSPRLSKPPQPPPSINFILDGKACCVPRKDIIYLDDLANAIDQCNPSSSSYADNYKFEAHGKQEFLCPPGVTCIATNKFREYEQAKKCIDNLYHVMSKDKCVFSEDAQLIMGCGYHCNGDGSDEATLNIQAATLCALFREMGIPSSKISNHDIAKGLPSRS